MDLSTNWLWWALLSAFFAALTAIFAKVGLQGVNSDYATLIRTIVILIVLSVFVYFTRVWSNPLKLPSRTLWFLILSGIATGLSWMCYFRALKVGEAFKVAPVDKLSVVIVAILAVLFLGEKPGLKDWTGIGFICVGALLLALKGK